jgi:hypothetical protein
MVYDLAMGKAVGNYPAGTKWPCFGTVPSFLGSKHWLVQPPDIGNLCAEGDAGGTFTPNPPDPAAIAAATAPLSAKIAAARAALS